MSEKVGIENLKKITESIAVIATMIGSMAEDAKLSLKDMTDFIQGSYKTFNIIKHCDWSKILEEFNDLDDKEQAEIKDIFVQKFDIKYDELEKVIEDLLTGAVYFLPAIFAIISKTKK